MHTSKGIKKDGQEHTCTLPASTSGPAILRKKEGRSAAAGWRGVKRNVLARTCITNDSGGRTDRHLIITELVSSNKIKVRKRQTHTSSRT